MKYLLPFFAFLYLTTSLSAQEKFSIPSSHLLKIQGGYFYDYGFEKKYSGFNILSVGLLTVKAPNKMQGIEFDLIAYNLEADNLQPDVEQSKVFGEVNLFKSYAVFGDVNKGVFFGPMVSAGYFRDITAPQTSLSFPVTTSSVTVGAGFKVDFMYRLKERLFLSLGSKLTVLDFGVDQRVVENPVLPIQQRRSGGFNFDFLRSQVPVLLGFKFVL